MDIFSRRRFILILSGYALAVALTLLVCPFIGGETILPGRVIEDLRSGIWSIGTHIVIEQRLPRVILGLLAGGALAMTGAVFQVILRNPLAEPYTLGVTGGGAVGASLAFFYPSLVLSIGPFSTVQLLSVAGSSIILAVLYLMAKRQAGLSMSTLLLAGVTMGIICGSIILLLRYLSGPHQLIVMDRWLMGGLDILGGGEIASLMPLLVPGIGFLIMTIPSLNHLGFGRELAAGQGVDVTRIQRFAFIGGSLATAAVVSLAGPIGFVGLIVPHAVRRLSGGDQRIVVPAAWFAGGIFLVVCDTFARTIIAPMEMPVGVLTALCGGPFFLFILLRKPTQQRKIR